MKKYKVIAVDFTDSSSVTTMVDVPEDGDIHSIAMNAIKERHPSFNERTKGVFRLDCEEA